MIDQVALGHHQVNRHLDFETLHQLIDTGADLLALGAQGFLVIIQQTVGGDYQHEAVQGFFLLVPRQHLQQQRPLPAVALVIVRHRVAAGGIEDNGLVVPLEVQRRALLMLGKLHRRRNQLGIFQRGTLAGTGLAEHDIPGQYVNRIATQFEVGFAQCLQRPGPVLRQFLVQLLR